MSINKTKLKEIIGRLAGKIVLVAVSKTKSVADIKELYDLGHKDFGENYVQELKDKYEELPKDINWHFIGHLQSNKVKYIAPFVHLIHAVDSYNLLKEINKQGEKNNRIINCLFQVHIAAEETKFGFDENELEYTISQLKSELMNNVKITGLMGIASFTNEVEKITSEFKFLKNLFDKYAHLPAVNFQLSTLSMGMSADYEMAIEQGSNMVRIGSLIFGERTSL
ncbi:MAG: YggS family pyridoxal phosphate-dependent enzyme [Segetibacter sp.]|nr:YggS family pyridoxal phosphate-dependent enzyme [Segetibacter sp.]